jgi:hypothetical protein
VLNNESGLGRNHCRRRVDELNVIRLDGARTLRREVLRRWACRAIQRKENGRSYVLGFSCPICGGQAYELCVKMEDFRPALGHDLWDVQCRSECGHVDAEYSQPTGSILHFEDATNDEAMLIIPIEKRGGRTFWYRSEEDKWMPGCGATTPARFGSLWQAIHASADECQLLAALQGEFGTTR